VRVPFILDETLCAGEACAMTLLAASMGLDVYL
jgi:hypothetical protein